VGARQMYQARMGATIYRSFATLI